MQTLSASRPVLVLQKTAVVFIAVVVHHAVVPAISAALESGIYRTTPGATVEERGDRVPNGIRIVPISATLTFDLLAVPPSLTAAIPNAVLEGGDPFALVVHSSSGNMLADGSYRFTGDYLKDIDPSGTQYLFDWRFRTATGGNVTWNGNTFWAGGHIWLVTISDLPMVFQGPSLPGDFDLDGDVDGAGFSTWQTNFPRTTGASVSMGDADRDGDVDGADFIVWQTNFPYPPRAATVPEPSTIPLVLLSVPAFVALRRRLG